MTESREEREEKKRAIFESMSKRGQERVLRMGYENWEPFQDPKDPRDKIRSSIAMRSARLLQTFYQAGHEREMARAYGLELRDLCQGLLRGDARARVIYEFCNWFKEHGAED